MENRILLVTASARNKASVSRKLGIQLADQLSEPHDNSHVIHVDLSESEIPVVNDDWVSANFTSIEDRNDDMREILSLSDTLINDLQTCNTVIIATPIYNFAIPAALKAYIDQICRAGVTFKYTKEGPAGLLEDKKAYILVTSGGVPLESPVDFATPHLKQVLNFIGISNIETIDATQLSGDDDPKIAALEKLIST